MPLARELETECWAQEGMAGKEADRKPRQTPAEVSLGRRAAE